MTKLTIEQRFEEKYIPEPNSGCWLWVGASNGTYGNFYVGMYPKTKKRKCVPAYKFSYEMHKGPVPDGLEVDHKCNNTHCVNPDHLQVITHRENILRGQKNPPAINARKTHCNSGHEFTDENTYVEITRKCRMKRHCKICRDSTNKRRKFSKKALRMTE